MRAHATNSVEHLRPHDRDHALLRLGDHDLPRLHVAFAQRHAVELDVDPGSVASHLGQCRCQSRRAAVLQRLDQPRVDELQRRLDQLLAGEGIADLN